jgi:hypothetical protein
MTLFKAVAKIPSTFKLSVIEEQMNFTLQVDPQVVRVENLKLPD